MLTPLTRVVCTLVGFCSAAACGRIDTRVGTQLSDAASTTEAGPSGGAGEAGTGSSLYIEAESGQLANGFMISMDPDASGGEYIVDPSATGSTSAPGSASADYSFNVENAGTYRLWGRLRGPDPLHNSFWVSIDGSQSVLWQLSTGYTWFWGAVTKGTDYKNPLHYVLSMGAHRLTIFAAQPIVGLDRLYFSTTDNMPPGNNTPCDPPNSIQLMDGTCEPGCGTHGPTTCGSPCVGQPLLVAYDCVMCCLESDAGAVDSGAN
jgi:hypothetical protein